MHGQSLTLYEIVLGKGFPYTVWSCHHLNQCFSPTIMFPFPSAVFRHEFADFQFRTIVYLQCSRTPAGRVLSTLSQPRVSSNTAPFVCCWPSFIDGPQAPIWESHHPVAKSNTLRAWCRSSMSYWREEYSALAVVTHCSPANHCQAHLRQQFLELVANKIVMIRHHKEKAGL